MHVPGSQLRLPFPFPFRVGPTPFLYFSPAHFFSLTSLEVVFSP